MKVHLRNAEWEEQLNKQKVMWFYDAVENALMPKNFPRVRLLPEEMDVQNTSAKNIQLEIQKYIYFCLLQSKTEALYTTAVF